MYRKLYKKERQWIEKVLDIEFKGKDILLNQIRQENVEYEQGYDYTSIKFKIDENVEKYPYQVRVPVEMRAFQENVVPLVFLLHIKCGIIDELELITADSSEINLDNINMQDVEYEVHESVL